MSAPQSPLERYEAIKPDVEEFLRAVGFDPVPLADTAELTAVQDHAVSVAARSAGEPWAQRQAADDIRLQAIEGVTRRLREGDGFNGYRGDLLYRPFGAEYRSVDRDVVIGALSCANVAAELHQAGQNSPEQRDEFVALAYWSAGLAIGAVWGSRAYAAAGRGGELSVAASPELTEVDILFDSADAYQVPRAGNVQSWYGEMRNGIMSRAEQKGEGSFWRYSRGLDRLEASLPELLAQPSLLRDIIKPLDDAIGSEEHRDFGHALLQTAVIPGTALLYDSVAQANYFS